MRTHIHFTLQGAAGHHSAVLGAADDGRPAMLRAFIACKSSFDRACSIVNNNGQCC